MTAGAEGEGAGDDRERAAKSEAAGFAGNRHAEMVVRAGAGREGIVTSDCS